jgi:RNA-dependent RNA polymerase
MCILVLCFDLLTPAIFEEEDFYRSDDDNKKFRRRIGSLHPGHARISPYCHHMRVVLHNDLDVFLKLCTAAEQLCVKAQIDASAHRFFSPKYIHCVSKWLITLEKHDWRVAFQIEAMLRNGFLHMADLWTHFRQPIDALCREHADDTSEVLRCFSQALQPIAPADHQTALTCFRQVLSQRALVTRPSLPSRMFYCHHVCVTPTKLLLEGPFATQTNRVIRKWQAYEDNFIRVDFRDEDRLKYNWDSETDGGSFLRDRVGGILKNGFELVGRRFEFLAYSSSALR